MFGVDEYSFAIYAFMNIAPPVLILFKLYFNVFKSGKYLSQVIQDRNVSHIVSWRNNNNGEMTDKSRMEKRSSVLYGDFSLLGWNIFTMLSINMIFDIFAF